VTELPSRSPGNPEPAGQAVLGSPLTRARWAIFWERLWPALASIGTAIGLFIIVSWLGVWLWLPPLWRAVAMLLLFVMTAAASVPLLRLRIPTIQEGLQRLDRVSGLPHRPATTVTDAMATATGDPLSTALWRAHLVRAAEAARGLKAGYPSPQLATHDPYALRGLVLVLLAVTFFAAGGERVRRITAAFDFRGVVTPANFRVDAWVTPPLYTSKSPILLPGMRPGEPTPAAASYSVPIGSILVVRASGASGLDIVTQGDMREAPAGSKPPTGSEERRYTIDGNGTATIRGYGSDVTWTFSAIADKPPTIALAKDPEIKPGGALQLTYKIEDDYGATEAQAIFKSKEMPDKGAGKKARPLYDAPEFPLSLPQARTRNGTGQTFKNLAEHPFAGADMTLELVAKDQAGNEGRSEPFEMKLPQRPFFNPVAKALIEQRRMIAVNADSKSQVLAGLDALTIAPERFTPDTNIYLGLRSLYWNLTNARSDDELRDVATRMWAMAQQIEDGNMGDAAAQLRAAQEALRQALDRNASDEEIKQLMDRLRQAMNNFLQALAQEMRRNPDQRPLPPNTRMLSQQQLNNMLDKMEQAARSGNKDAARQMLEEMQAMMEGLQMARPGQGGDDPDMQALNDLAEMIQRQRELRDKTFKEGQDARRTPGGRQPSDPGQMGQLRSDQQALRDKLNKMLEEMRKRGNGQQPGDQPGEDGQGDGLDQLGKAGEAMGDAEGQLGEGNADSATGSQGKALDALRKGAQNLAQSMQQQRGQGRGTGQPGPGQGQARANGDTDPLGRPLRGTSEYSDDTRNNVPGEIDVQRARRILEELRKRLGESERPRLELEYIERLLKDF
jgi:uncharacterized protein (TIGR02302 family)